MKQIIFDCDSTAGIPGYPMDDALALFYLLGRPQEAEAQPPSPLGSAGDLVPRATPLMTFLTCLSSFSFLPGFPGGEG